MAKWLDKYEQGGMVLKKKTKDNYGKRENPNNVKASVGPDFVGLGYNTKGRDYSPAWGGQFQMGGSLPGAVGFTYARVAGSAPANGKYTKKTKASAQDGGLFSTNTQAAQDATRNVIPRKMTAQEKKEAEEASKKAIAAGKARDEKIIAERKKNTSTKGDINTPGSFHTADKLRMFPESVGGLGEMYDEYINPAMMVGSLADAVGESVAARSPEGVALSLGMAAGMGALGMDPLGTALKYKNVGSNYLKNLQQRGAIVQTAGGMPVKPSTRFQEAANIAAERTRIPSQPPTRYGGISQAEIDRYMQNVDRPGTPPSQESANRAAEQMRIIRNEREAAIRQQNTPRALYQAPTDAELLRMNEAEANRYAPRVNRTGRQPLGTPDDMRALENEGPSTAEQQSWFNQTQQTNDVDPDFERFRAGVTQQYPVDRELHSSLQNIADNALARIRNRPVTPQGQELRQRIEDLERTLRDAQRQSNVYEQLVSEDDLVDRAISSASPSPIEAGPKWGDKEFKLGQAKPGFNRYTDDKGNSFIQDVKQLDNDLFGEYTINGPDGGYMKLKTQIDKDQQGYLKVNNMTFRSEDEKISDGQFKKIMAHLPPKVEMGYISTSMYSQPLMDAQVARWANNKPGRIELKDIHLEELNPWHKNHADAIYDASTGEKYGDYFEQLKRQFPRIQKTAKSIANATGYEIPEPKLKLYDRSRNVPEYVEVPFEDLKTQEWKDYIEQNPQVKSQFKIFAPKYEIKKNWKNGGHIVDPMGQWAHPGEVTTIPSNDITMKGVDYDVLGVSNTGDKKLMKPGKNYKFDGDSVTEYPKGGWLNKYK